MAGAFCPNTFDTANNHVRTRLHAAQLVVRIGRRWQRWRLAQQLLQRKLVVGRLFILVKLVVKLVSEPRRLRLVRACIRLRRRLMSTLACRRVLSLARQSELMETRRGSANGRAEGRDRVDEALTPGLAETDGERRDRRSFDRADAGSRPQPSSPCRTQNEARSGASVGVALRRLRRRAARPRPFRPSVAWWRLIRG